MMDYIVFTDKKGEVLESKAIKINLKNFETALKFIEAANSYVSDIDIFYNENSPFDAKSMIAVMNLDWSKDVYVRIISDNVDERRRFDSEMEAFR